MGARGGAVGAVGAKRTRGLKGAQWAQWARWVQWAQRDSRVRSGAQGTLRAQWDQGGAGGVARWVVEEGRHNL